LISAAAKPKMLGMKFLRDLFVSFLGSLWAIWLLLYLYGHNAK
jgi:hypothetical protein